MDSILAGLKWAPVRKQPGVEQVEFMHKCTGWKKARCFVVVRCVGDFHNCLQFHPAVTGGQQPALAGQNPADDDVAEKSAATSSLNASR